MKSKTDVWTAIAFSWLPE